MIRLCFKNSARLTKRVVCRDLGLTHGLRYDPLPLPSYLICNRETILRSPLCKYMSRISLHHLRDDLYPRMTIPSNSLHCETDPTTFSVVSLPPKNLIIMDCGRRCQVLHMTLKVYKKLKREVTY